MFGLQNEFSAVELVLKTLQIDISTCLFFLNHTVLEALKRAEHRDNLHPIINQWSKEETGAIRYFRETSQPRKAVGSGFFEFHLVT